MSGTAKAPPAAAAFSTARLLGGVRSAASSDLTQNQLPSVTAQA